MQSRGKRAEITNCAPKTLELYRQPAKYFTEATANEIRRALIVTLKHVQLETALRALLKQRAARREHISARTVRHVAGVIQVALNEAFRPDLIAVSPMLKVRLTALDQKQLAFLTPEEVRVLRDVCRGDWTFVLVELALASGARRGELYTLQWRDIDWATRTLFNTKSIEQTECPKPREPALAFRLPVDTRSGGADRLRTASPRVIGRVISLASPSSKSVCSKSFS